MQKLGSESPLPLSKIKTDFTGRRRQLKHRREGLVEHNQRIAVLLQKYGRITDGIASLIKLSQTAVDPDFHAGADLEEQYHLFSESFRQLSAANVEQEKKISSRYLSLQGEYGSQNQHTVKIFQGLEPLWAKVSTGFDGYYYLYERMVQQTETLEDLIRVYELRLANLERSKTDMVRQSYLQGMQFYEEIEKISAGSTVKIQGKSRAVQMLKIEMPAEAAGTATERMQSYIAACIEKIRQDYQEGKKKDEVRKAIARFMASRELLNQFLGTAHIPIQAYKIDLNIQNSGHKSWEQVIRENSGGEKFVVFFTVLSALMAYSRSSLMEAAGESGEDTRVLIMDNPFGPISSGHLLTPLFEIAKKYRTQLICLTDLKQNSIMNCFNLIYMLKIRPSLVGNNEYLKLEEYIRDQNSLHEDEALEKAVYRVSDFKQVSLFEGGDE